MQAADERLANVSEAKSETYAGTDCGVWKVSAADGTPSSKWYLRRV